MGFGRESKCDANTVAMQMPPQNYDVQRRSSVKSNTSSILGKQTAPDHELSTVAILAQERGLADSSYLRNGFVSEGCAKPHQTGKEPTSTFLQKTWKLPLLDRRSKQPRRKRKESAARKKLEKESADRELNRILQQHASHPSDGPARALHDRSLSFGGRACTYCCCYR
eukprot:2078094-Amphidinium_carterae.3